MAGFVDEEQIPFPFEYPAELLNFVMAQPRRFNRVSFIDNNTAFSVAVRIWNRNPDHKFVPIGVAEDQSGYWCLDADNGGVVLVDTSRGQQQKEFGLDEWLEQLPIPTPRAVGIDIGTVMQLSGKSGEAPFLGDNYLATPEVPGAVDAISQLVREFNGNVFVISEGDKLAAKIISQWLESHDFFSKTNLSPDHVILNVGQGGSTRIAEEHELTDFVCGKLGMLKNLTSVETWVLFDPNPREAAQFPAAGEIAKAVFRWPDALLALGCNPERGMGDPKVHSAAR